MITSLSAKSQEVYRRVCASRMEGLHGPQDLHQ